MKKIIILIFCLFNYIKSSEKCLDELETLIGFGLIPAIGGDLYEHTYALTSRPIFTLPALNNNLNSKKPCHGLTFNFFYNNTPGLYTTKSDSSLNNYIKISDSDILKLIENDSLTNQSTIPFTILDEFKNSTISEYRFGSLITANYLFNNNFRFEIGIPLVYQLRHYDLPEENILEIKRYNLFDQSTNNSNSSIYKFVVGDTIGFDDGFCRLGWVYNNCNIEIETGFLGIIPTGTSFKTGIIGQDFRKYNVNPLVNYAELLVNAVENPQYTKEQLQEVAIQASYRLSAMTLNQPLGQESRGGLGIYNKGSFLLEDNCFIEWITQGAYLFKRNNIRYYITDKNKALYQTSIYQKLLDDYSDNPSPELLKLICEAVNFLNNSITNTLFPEALNICLHPQWWYQAQFVAHANYECWHLLLGLDWWQRANPCNNLSNAEFIKYNINKAKVYYSQYQLKLIGGLGGCLNKNWGDLYIWFKIDQTMIRQGIGLDRTLNIQLDLAF